MSDFVKAFAAALIDHLRGTTYKFTHKRTGDLEDCPTCGYGEEVYEVLDMEKLEKEIDDFSKTFNNEQKEPK